MGMLAALFANRIFRIAGLTLILVGLLWWGWHREISAAEKRGSDAAYAAIADKARALEATANKLGRDVATLTRSMNDETNRRIASDADALRLRGPGKAACAAAAGDPAAAGGRDAPGGSADGGVDRLPYPQWEPLIAMPFAELVERAERCDLNRAEALSWRDWHKRLTEEWDKLRTK